MYLNPFAHHDSPEGNSSVSSEGGNTCSRIRLEDELNAIVEELRSHPHSHGGVVSSACLRQMAMQRLAERRLAERRRTARMKAEGVVVDGGDGTTGAATNAAKNHDKHGQQNKRSSAVCLASKFVANQCGRAWDATAAFGGMRAGGSDCEDAVNAAFGAGGGGSSAGGNSKRSSVCSSSSAEGDRRRQLVIMRRTSTYMPAYKGGDDWRGEEEGNGINEQHEHHHRDVHVEYVLEENHTNSRRKSPPMMLGNLLCRGRRVSSASSVVVSPSMMGHSATAPSLVAASPAEHGNKEGSNVFNKGGSNCGSVGSSSHGGLQGAIGGFLKRHVRSNSQQQQHDDKLRGEEAHQEGTELSTMKSSRPASAYSAPALCTQYQHSTDSISLDDAPDLLAVERVAARYRSVGRASQRAQPQDRQQEQQKDQHQAAAANANPSFENSSMSLNEDDLDAIQHIASLYGGGGGGDAPPAATGGHESSSGRRRSLVRRRSTGAFGENVLTAEERGAELEQAEQRRRASITRQQPPRPATMQEEEDSLEASMDLTDLIQSIHLARDEAANGGHKSRPSPKKKEEENPARQEGEEEKKTRTSPEEEKKKEEAEEPLSGSELAAAPSETSSPTVPRPSPAARKAGAQHHQHLAVGGKIRRRASQVRRASFQDSVPLCSILEDAHCASKATHEQMGGTPTQDLSLKDVFRANAEASLLLGWNASSRSSSCGSNENDVVSGATTMDASSLRLEGSDDSLLVGFSVRRRSSLSPPSAAV